MIVEVILDWPLWKINQSPNCSWNYRILRFFHLGFIFSSTESWLLCHLWIFPDSAGRAFFLLDMRYFFKLCFFIRKILLWWVYSLRSRRELKCSLTRQAPCINAALRFAIGCVFSCASVYSYYNSLCSTI